MSASLSMFIRICVPIALLAVVLSIFNPALAEESLPIAFKDHRIDPRELRVPAGRIITRLRGPSSARSCARRQDGFCLCPIFLSAILQGR